MNRFTARIGSPQTAALMAAALCLATPASAQSRGELLYITHCSSCHTAQMHWRDKKQVTDWASLRAQVRYWQAQATLAWNDEDITLVARYLNASYYRLPAAPKQLGQGMLLNHLGPGRS